MDIQCKYGDRILLEEFVEGRDTHVPILNGETLQIIEASVDPKEK